MSAQTLSLHRRSLSVSLSPCPPLSVRGSPVWTCREAEDLHLYFFCQYLLWPEDQELTGEKKQAADWHLLKTFISPNLVPPVILERPLWPVGAGEGLLKGWWVRRTQDMVASTNHVNMFSIQLLCHSMISSPDELKTQCLHIQHMDDMHSWMRGLVLVPSTTQVSGNSFQYGQGQREKNSFYASSWKSGNLIYTWIIVLETTMGRQMAPGHQRTQRGSEYELYSRGGLHMILRAGPLEFLVQNWNI